MAVTVRFNGAALQSLTVQASEADLKVRANRVLNAARRNAPVDTSRLRSSIAVSFDRGAAGPLARIGSNLEYAIFVHEGTGIYGPTGAPIRPRRATILRWPATNNSGAGTRRFKGGRTSQYVWAREVRGSPGRPFLLNALDAAR